jgi:hypothetical protein
MSPILLRALALLSLLGVAACDRIELGMGARDPRIGFGSGIYQFDAWSDFGGRAPVWSGEIRLRGAGGRSVSGDYWFPMQCADRFGRAIDCVGRVSGWIEPDGRISLTFDNGWLIVEGRVHGASRASGVWELRSGGLRDYGDFDLFRY